jgi:peptide/nickel transport system permease protein
LLKFDFGASDEGRDIGREIGVRMWPSLALAIPTFILGLLVSIAFSLSLVFFRTTRLDFWGVVLCVFMLSISGLFYIIAGQWLFSKILRLVPYSGFAWGWDAVKFLALPILVAIIARLGPEARFYRSLFLEEIGKDYVRTARARGLSERVVLFKHVLRNAMLPILTGTVSALPLLFMGSLIAESFFLHSRSGELHHRCDRRTRFFSCARHGLFGREPLYRRFDSGGYFLHARRSARAF